MPRPLPFFVAAWSREQVPEAERLVAGISGGLVRLSVGLEDSADLIADLAQALDAAQTS